MQSRPTSRQAAQAEETAQRAEEAGQRLFVLKLSKDDPEQSLRFITFGCQGNGSKAQREVALQLNDLCGNPETRPDFILILGDNMYEWGVKYSDDPDFIKYFDAMYLDLPHLKNIPFFLIAGNHDENFQNAAMAAKVKEKGIQRIMHQVAHTFLGDDKLSAQQKTAIFNDSVLDVRQLSAWNMPRRYYSLIVNDVQIFCLDSNTYVDEFLELAAERLQLPPHIDQATWLIEKAKTNQAAWLECQATEARYIGRKVIVAQHHPLYTPGKRAYERVIHNDLGIYLGKTKIEMLRKIQNMPQACEETPYNLCLTECYRLQKLSFDLVLAAHDHDIYNYSNINTDADDYKICELVVGSGGGELQERTMFSDQHLMGCFLKQTGLAIVSHQTGAPHFNYSIRTSDHQHQLEFNTHSPSAIIAWDDNNPEHDEIHAFFEVVESAINAYFKFLGERQNTHQGRFFSLAVNVSHGQKGAERAHQLWAYIKNHRPQSFATAVHIVHMKTKREWHDMEPGEHSLITLLDDAMKRKYHINMEKFAEKISRRPVKLEI